ncbi:hypothetical protein RvY_12431 [Ramazzottius varieornatus]|uniref:Ubiquitin carboxyl-terminal hydrolase n=1 Tax=Ramazzottius varieornatus TaxID=947166 RepID=A0A1D1VS42_RAMVA|nr:hypothetical protein RvY_12431 [Ramazzottius varieornatus]
MTAAEAEESCQQAGATSEASVPVDLPACRTIYRSTSAYGSGRLDRDSAYSSPSPSYRPALPTSSPTTYGNNAGSYRTYKNAIAEYTATLERVRAASARRTSVQDLTEIGRDRAQRAALKSTSSLALDRIGLPPPSTRSSSVTTSGYSSSLSSAIASPISARSRASISESPPARTSSPSSSRYSSNYGSAILGSSTPTPSWRSTVYSSPSLLRKTASDSYTSSYQPSNRSRSSISTSRARDDDEAEIKAEVPRKSAYSRAAASLDALSSLELTSKYANSSTPTKARPSYSRQESLEKAREILAKNNSTKEEGSSSSYGSLKSSSSSRYACQPGRASSPYDSGIDSSLAEGVSSRERRTSGQDGGVQVVTTETCGGSNGDWRRRPSDRDSHATSLSSPNDNGCKGDDDDETATVSARSLQEMNSIRGPLSRYQPSGSHRSKVQAESADAEAGPSVYRRQGSISTYPSRLRDLSALRCNSGSGENDKENLADLYVRGVAGGRASLSADSSTSTLTSMQPGSSRLSKATVSLDETDKAGLIGLKNIGNTCFMNSILQCLSNTKPLRDYTIGGQYLSELNPSKDSPLMAAFAAVMEALWKKHSSYCSSNAYDPDRFHRKIQQYAPRFSGYLQQDAQEFLRYVLEGLHEDVNRVTTKYKGLDPDIADHLDDQQKAAEAWKRYLKRDNSKIVDLYVGQLKSSLICDKCGHCSVTFDPFWDLALPIPTNRGASSDIDIYDCFKHFTKKEVMDGDERPMCAKCKSRQRCTKFFSIQRFPKCLVIHLKRFSQERYRAKISSMVDYPIEGLDLAPFAADSYKGPRPRYNLFAVSCHAGSTHSGHYTAFCKNPSTGKWNEYNDSRVSPADVRDVLTSDAYLLFYELAL